MMGGGTGSRFGMRFAIVLGLVVVLLVPAASFITGSQAAGVHPNSLTAKITIPAGGHSMRQATTSLGPQPQGLIDEYNVGFSPGAEVFDPINGNIFVVNIGSDNVSDINGTTHAVTSVPLGPVWPHFYSGIWWQSYAVFDSANNIVYVSVSTNPNVTAIYASNDTVAATIGPISPGCGYVCSPPGTMAVDDATDAIWVEDGNGIRIIDGADNQLLGTVANSTGSTSSGLVFDSANGYFYEAPLDYRFVNAIDPSTQDIVASIPTSVPVATAVFDSSNGDIYVAAYSYPYDPQGPKTSVITVINGSSNTVVGMIHAGGQESRALAVDSNADFVITLTFNFSTNPCICEVAVIDGKTNTVLETFPNSPWGSFGGADGVTFDDANGYVYISYNRSMWTPPQTGDVASFSLPPLSVGLSASRPATDVGVSVAFRANVSGGSWGGPYSFNYSESSPSAGCIFTNNSVVTCSPTSNGSFNISVRVRNSEGESATATSPTLVVGPLLQTTLNVSSFTPLLGQTVAFVANVTGGASPYNYTWSGFPPGCVSEDKPAVGCLPTQADNYNITVHVRDQNNVTVNATASIHVIFDFNVVIPASTPVGKQLTIMVNTNETFNGSAINKTALFRPAGGYGTFTYSYSGLPPGCTSADIAVLTCTPTQSGKYSVTVSVHDQIGDHQTHTVLVNIVPASGGGGGTVPPHNTFLGLPGYDGYVLVGGIVAAVVIAVTFLMWRKRGSTSPAVTTKDESKGGKDAHEKDTNDAPPENEKSTGG